MFILGEKANWRFRLLYVRYRLHKPSIKASSPFIKCRFTTFVTPEWRVSIHPKHHKKSLLSQLAQKDPLEDAAFSHFHIHTQKNTNALKHAWFSYVSCFSKQLQKWHVFVEKKGEYYQKLLFWNTCAPTPLQLVITYSVITDNLKELLKRSFQVTRACTN